MVTIDTLSVGLAAGDDENDNAMMGSIVAELAKIRSEFGCTVVLVHHLRKEADVGAVSLNSLRGGAALGCNIDQAFLVTRKEGQQVVRLGKNKDGEDDREIARSDFQVVTVGTDDDGFPVTSGVLVPVPVDPAASEDSQVAALVAHYRQQFGDQEFTQSNAEQLRPEGMVRAKLRELIDKARAKGLLPVRLDGKTILYSVVRRAS